MAIFWNYEKALLGNNHTLIKAMINRAPEYCSNQCTSAEDNLNYLTSYAQAAQTRADEYGRGQSADQIMDVPAGNQQAGMNIVNGLLTSASHRESNGLSATDPYDYGNVSLNPNLYTHMIKMGWTVFNTDLSEGPNTFFILSYCQYQAAMDAIKNHHGDLSGHLYNSWCSP